jgi:hypothetical protein
MYIFIILFIILLIFYYINKYNKTEMKFLNKCFNQINGYSDNDSDSEIDQTYSILKK